MSMAEYLDLFRSDPMRYANGAIGEPQMIDTANGPTPWPCLFEPDDLAFVGFP
jgi:hypothetical protein